MWPHGAKIDALETDLKKTGATLINNRAAASQSLQMLSQTTPVTVLIQRPNLCGMECISMQVGEWEKYNKVVFYPDGKGSGPSIVLDYKQPGHFVFSHSSEEKVVMTGFQVAEIDLGPINEAWTGCIAMLIAGEF